MLLRGCLPEKMPVDFGPRLTKITPARPRLSDQPRSPLGATLRVDAIDTQDRPTPATHVPRWLAFFMRRARSFLVRRENRNGLPSSSNANSDISALLEAAPPRIKDCGQKESTEVVAASPRRSSASTWLSLLRKPFGENALSIFGLRLTEITPAREPPLSHLCVEAMYSSRLPLTSSTAAQVPRCPASF